jgi:arsenite methyltransferase
VNDGSGADKWAAWVLARSHAGDAEQKRRSLRYLEPIRDRVLSNADVGVGDSALDVGAGDGLIAFGAIPLVGSSGQVFFSDVSLDLLEHCRGAAQELGVTDRCRFVEASADDLSPIEDDSADVVTTRSVLIYVDSKDRAFREFHRVLRPGGRLSIFEPINRYFPEDPNEFWGFDATPVRDLVEKISAYEGSDVEHAEDDPMMNFTRGTSSGTPRARASVRCMSSSRSTLFLAPGPKTGSGCSAWRRTRTRRPSAKRSSVR